MRKLLKCELGSIHCLNAGSVDGISEVHAASIFRVEVI